MGYQPASSRTIAFAAIVFSTVAVTGCLLMFPMVFHYVQTLEANVQVEIDFCKVSTNTDGAGRETMSALSGPRT